MAQDPFLCSKNKTILVTIWKIAVFTYSGGITWVFSGYMCKTVTFSSKPTQFYAYMTAGPHYVGPGQYQTCCVTWADLKCMTLLLQPASYWD